MAVLERNVIPERFLASVSSSLASSHLEHKRRKKKILKLRNRFNTLTAASTRRNYNFAKIYIQLVLFHIYITTDKIIHLHNIHNKSR